MEIHGPSGFTVDVTLGKRGGRKRPHEETVVCLVRLGLGGGVVGGCVGGLRMDK